jgi:uncharacterized protein YegL
MARIGNEGIVRKQLVLFFVVDTSGSMAGEKIGAVNTAIREALGDSAFTTAGGADAKISIAVLEFNTDCKWLTPMPAAIESYQWRDLEADGGTYLGVACRELSKKLDEKAFLINPDGGGMAAPVIILLSDGEPNDDFEQGLDILKQNPYFNQTIRLACAIGDDANFDVLAKFTGGKESVLRVHTPEALRKWIQVVSLIAVKRGSQSQPTKNGAATDVQDAVAGEIQNATKNDPVFVEDANAVDDWETYN